MIINLKGNFYFLLKLGKFSQFNCLMGTIQLYNLILDQYLLCYMLH